MTDWRSNAACLDHDPEAFFAPDPYTIAYAKGVCFDCPVRRTCLDGAIERREPAGVWGGVYFGSANGARPTDLNQQIREARRLA